MGLILHYPLDGDLLNYSGTDSGTAIGAITPNSNGKIGSTYDFSAGRIDLDSSSLSLHLNMTLSFWVYMDAYPTSRCGIMETSYGAEFAINVTDLGGIQVYYGTSGGQALPYTSISSPTGFVEVGKWVHVTIVRDLISNKVNLYKNGLLITEATLAYIPTPTTNNILKIGASYTGNLLGKLNDVRIYDKALSLKEIQEVYKTKILHYTFNQLEEPTTNVVINPMIPYTPYNTLVQDGNDLTLTMVAGSVKYLTLHNGTDYVGQTLAISGYMFKNGEPHIIPGTKANTYQTGLTSIYSDPNTGYFEIIEEHNVSSIWIFHTPSGAADNDIITITDFQVEIKDHVTPFTSTSREGIVKDGSGFRNEAILEELTTPESFLDSKIGSRCYNFKGNNDHIPNLKTPNPNEPYSVMLWAKPTITMGETRRDLILGSGTNWNPGLWADSTTLRGHGATEYRTKNITWPINEWHMVGQVFDGTNVYLIWDGVLSLDTRTSYSPPANNSLYIGSPGVTNSNNWVGLIDDVRVYATDLSGEDVMEIYKTRAQLDNKGSLFVNQVTESVDYGRLINEGIENKTFTNGLSSYTQSNCQVTLTDDGYRIYRPPNLIYPTDGNTMWGGLILKVSEEAKVIGRKYRIRFRMKGVTSNSMSDRRIAYSVGYSSLGIGLPSRNLVNLRLADTSNFQEEDYQILESEYLVESNRLSSGSWNCDIVSGSNTVTYVNNVSSTPDVGVGDRLLDNSYFPNGTTVTSITTDVGFTVSNNALLTGQEILQTNKLYDTYREIKFGFSYTSTGTLGTDLYIRDLQILDITDNPEGTPINITGTGVSVSDSISEVGLTHGLTGYWKLNGDAKDYSGNGNHGTVVGATVSGGLKDLAYDFDYTTDKIDVGSIGNISTRLTISCWANSNDITLDQNMISRNGPYFLRFSNSRIRFNLRTDATGWLFQDGTTVLSSNTWYHLLMTYDGSNCKGYINGVEEFSVAKTGTVVDNGYLRFGYTTGGEDAPMNGKITEVKIFDRAISPDEIMTEYKRGLTNLGMQSHIDGTLYLNNKINESL